MATFRGAAEDFPHRHIVPPPGENAALGKQEKRKTATDKAEKLGFADAECTIVLCCDEDSENCAKASQMKKSLKYLRRRAKELKRERGVRLTVVPSQCLKICKFGPIAGSYPDGVWYGGCKEEVLEQIIAAQLDGADRPEQHVIADPGAADRAKKANGDGAA